MFLIFQKLQSRLHFLQYGVTDDAMPSAHAIILISFCGIPGLQTSSMWLFKKNFRQKH